MGVLEETWLCVVPKLIMKLDLGGFTVHRSDILLNNLIVKLMI